MAVGVANNTAVMFPQGVAHRITLLITIVVAPLVTLIITRGLPLGLLLMTQVGAAELLAFEFERNAQRYSVSSVAYIDVPPEGVYAVLTDYAQLSRISNLVVESKDLGIDEDGHQLVYTINKGCLAMFCRSLEKVERLRAVPFELIVTDAVAERSDVAFSHSEWRLLKEGRGTRLVYQMSTDISFWVPPVIGNYMLSRWLKKGAANAVQRIEYFAWHSLYGDDAGPTKPEPGSEPGSEPEPELQHRSELTNAKKEDAAKHD